MATVLVNNSEAQWIAEGYAIGADGTAWSFWKPGARTNGRSDEEKYDPWTLRLDLSPRRLKPSDNGKGYLYLRLGADGPRDYVHRWVWRAWHGPIPDGQQVRHYDGDRSNNTLENLRLGSVEANAADKAMHDTHPIGERSSNALMTDEQVMEARRLYRAGMMLSDVIESLSLTIAKQTLWKAVTGENWTHLDHIEQPIVKGRPRQPRGEATKNATLTDEQVVEARRLRRETDMTGQEIIVHLGLKATVYGLSAALTGRTWSHLNHISPPCRRMAPRP